MSGPQVAVVMAPLPAQGHLNQLLHLSHVITSHGIPVHYAGSAVHNRQAKERLHGRDSEISSKIEFHDFEFPCMSPPPNVAPGSHFPTHFQPMFDEAPMLRQSVSQLVQELSAKFRRVIVIHDNMMASAVQDVKLITNAECYIFIPCCAFTLFFGIWDVIPEKPFQLDSDTPVSCIPSQEGCFSPEVVSCVENESKYMNFQSGFLFNTCREIDGKYIDLVKMFSMNPNMKHFPIGPFHPVDVKSRSTGADRHECLEWLDKQEKDSVIYISFGSTTVMSAEQIRELALGLEKSGQKFLWVLKSADRVNIFTEDEGAAPELPEGYELCRQGERQGNGGKKMSPATRNPCTFLNRWIHKSLWLELLHREHQHGSACSSMAYAFCHSDQPRNAVLVTEVLKTGTVVRDWARRDEIVTSDVIDNAVKKLMASKDGDQMRTRASELGEAVRHSVAAGGSSHSEMKSFIAHMTR